MISLDMTPVAVLADPAGVAEVPTEVPTLHPELLGTSYGLLLNELHRSPEGVLAAASDLLLCALDLDTGEPAQAYY